MTENINTPEFNRFVADLLGDESSSQESTQESSKSSCPEKFDCFTITQRSKVKLWTTLDGNYHSYNVISVNKSKCQVKFKCVHNKTCDSFVTGMFQKNFGIHGPVSLVCVFNLSPYDVKSVEL